MVHYNSTYLLSLHDERLIKRLEKAETDIDRFNIYLHAPVKALNAKRIELDYTYIEEINHVLTTILAIARKPHFTVEEEDIIVRSSLVSTFSNEKFNKTVRDSSLWRNKNGDIVPEYAYTADFRDSYRIYENIVVLMAFNHIEQLIMKMDDYYESYLLNLNGYFAYDNYRFNSLFNATSQALLSKNKFELPPGIKNIIDRLSVIKRKIHLIKQTYFFHQLEGAKPIQGQIILTNVLKFNRKYNQVFTFYINQLQSNNVEVLISQRVNYFLSLIVKVVNKSFTLNEVDQVFNLKKINLKYSNEKFYLNILTNRKSSILFKVKSEDRRSIMSTSSFSIVDKLENYVPIKDVDAYEYLLMGDELYRYHDERFIPLQYDYAAGDVTLIEMIVSSLIVSIDINEDYQSRHCPICGKNNLNVLHKFDITCLSCGGDYATIVENTPQPYLWIKKIPVEVKWWRMK